MTYRRAHVVECDQCGATATVHGVGRRTAMRLFRQAGWEIEPGAMADMCPTCVRMDGDR